MGFALGAARPFLSIVRGPELVSEADKIVLLWLQGGGGDGR